MGCSARNHLLATGTPISNYVNQIFWLMWWCLGDSSLRFPYSYDGGLAAFEADFCVLEYTYGREGSETAHRREKRKVLPQITNVSRFWRLSGGCDDPPAKARLRRADRPLHAEDRQRPDGRRPARALREVAEQARFASFFAWKYPDHALGKRG